LRLAFFRKNLDCQRRSNLLHVSYAIALFPRFAQVGWRSVPYALCRTGGDHETPPASPAHWVRNHCEFDFVVFPSLQPFSPIWFLLPIFDAFFLGGNICKPFAM
jgi:hypothetical protein